MVSKSLRDRLIGAVDGSPSFFPMGTSPKGIIMYTPDGFMSAQLSKPDRKLFASGDWFKASDAGGTRHFRRGASSQLTCLPRATHSHVQVQCHRRLSIQRSRAAAPYERKSSVIIRSGAKSYFFRSCVSASAPRACFVRIGPGRRGLPPRRRQVAKDRPCGRESADKLRKSPRWYETIPSP